MVKFIFGLLLLVILILLAVLFVKEDPGFVLVQYADFSLETSLAFGIVAVVGVGLLVQILLRILLFIWRTPRKLRARAARRRIERSRNLLNQGLIDLAEGRFSQSESKLMKLIDCAENPLLHYLAAARAAQQQGKYDERDNYLKSAHEARPDAEIAIAVTQAELQLASDQTERALATLTHLKTLAPKHDYVTKLLARVYYQIEEWPQLCELLPEVRKKNLYRPNRLEKIEARTYRGCLEDAALHSNDDLQKAWAKLPKTAQTNGELVMRYIELRGQDPSQNSAIEDIIVRSVNKQWDANLVDFYGQMAMQDGNAQLAHAEKWLNDYGSNHTLLLALGRICIRLKLWGKAQSYLEASVGASATPQNCQVLADLLNREELAAHDKACEYYRRGLELSLGAGSGGQLATRPGAD
jgi:HemY protein